MTFDLTSLGWDTAFAAAYRAFDREGNRSGRVVRADRGVCTVLVRTGAVRASLAGAVLSAAAADPVALPCAGDWVVVRNWPDERLTVEAVLARRTAIMCRAADRGGGRSSAGQVIAANLDAAAVVEPVDPAPDLGRIERLLALVRQSGARPLVVLAPAGPAADPAALAARVAQVARVAPGAEVVALGVRCGDGLARLRRLVVPGQTLALLSRSGVDGKMLVNALAGVAVMHAREADRGGRHPTTYRMLVPIPGGGAVLDLPDPRPAGRSDAADPPSR